MPTPESLARQQIDQFLAASGWTVQDRLAMNLYAARGVAVRTACGRTMPRRYIKI